MSPDTSYFMAGKHSNEGIIDAARKSRQLERFVKERRIGENGHIMPTHKYNALSLINEEKLLGRDLSLLLNHLHITKTLDLTTSGTQELKIAKEISYMYNLVTIWPLNNRNGNIHRMSKWAYIVNGHSQQISYMQLETFLVCQEKLVMMICITLRREHEVQEVIKTLNMTDSCVN